MQVSADGPCWLALHLAHAVLPGGSILGIVEKNMETTGIIGVIKGLYEDYREYIRVISG